VSFLDHVLEAKRTEIARLREDPPRVAALLDPGFSRALRGPGLSVIAEIKRRSPSKGELTAGLDAGKTARAYAEGGAAAISCLTDQDFFGARASDLALARTAGLPVLRKDFLIDEIQIDESARLGAAAVLLIVRILGAGRLEALLRHAEALGLDALVEVHDAREAETALACGVQLLGVNHRDLKTFSIDMSLTGAIAPMLPPGTVLVAESGIRTAADVKLLGAVGAHAVLVGEQLMRAASPGAALRELLA